MTSLPKQVPAPPVHPTGISIKALRREKRSASHRAWAQKNRPHLREYAKLRWWANRERKLAQQNERRKKNLLRIREQGRASYRRNWGKRRARAKATYDALSSESKQSRVARGREYYRKAVRKVFALFGSKCFRCGFDDLRALQLDHVEGGGRAHRRKTGSHLYARILSGKESKEQFQLLCANCNWIKRHEKNECRGKNTI